MEEKWFVPYTWNGEPDTRYIMIRQQKYAQPIRDMVDKTLKNLGFADKTDPDYKKSLNSSTIIDLSNRTYNHLSIWNAGVFVNEVGEIPFAWPSQIPIFLTKHFGSLSGHQYGI